MDRNALIKALRDTAQSASNTIASNVSGPVDLIAAGLRGVGLPIPQNAIGGSQWMSEKGLTAPVQQGAAQVIGDTIGMAGPALVANYAPQIASALNRGAQNLAAGGAPAMRGQMGGVYMGGPRQEALETAQRNAAKPVSEGGLGLPPNNTPMDRARAMGFVDAYHGTADDITKIDPAKFGSATGAESAKKAFWAVSDPTTARGYAEYAATDAKVKRLLDAADKAEKRGKWDLYDDLVRQSEDLEASFRQNPMQGQNVMPLMVRANKGVRGTEMNAGGAEFVDLEGGVNKFLNQAIKDRRDLAVINNLADDVGLNGRPATHYAVLSPSVVRSRFAAFDPARINENDLLGRADPRLLGLMGLGAAGGLGAYNYMQGQ